MNDVTLILSPLEHGDTRAGYRLRKTIRTHRGGTIAAALLLLTLGLDATVGMALVRADERTALAEKTDAHTQRWEDLEQRGLALAAMRDAAVRLIFGQEYAHWDESAKAYGHPIAKVNLAQRTSVAPLPSRRP